MALLTRIVTLFCSCFWGVGASSAQDLAAFYKVTVQIEREGKVLGAPELIVASGASTSVSAEGVYLLNASVREEGRASPASVAVSSEIYFPRAGKWALVATPGLVMALGRGADMTYDLPEYGRVVLKYRVKAAARR